jgi:cytochrome c oxidase subunit 4
MASNAVVRDAQHSDQGHAHPSQAQYVRIAAILAVITAVEVIVYYIEEASAFLVPTLLVLSAVKFVMVVGYFMHLKFDSKLLMWTFTFAMIIAVAVFIGAWLMMHHGSLSQFTGDMSI